MPFVLILFYLLIEIALFIWIGGKIGIGWTLLEVLATFAIGAWMLKKGGEKSRLWLENAAAGAPQKGASQQVFWYIGGLLVILPGFFTDILGILLVFPPTQKLVTWFFSLFIPESVQTAFEIVGNYRNGRGNAGNSEVIEGEVEEIPQKEISES